MSTRHRNPWLGLCSHRFPLGHHCVTTCPIRDWLDVLQLPLSVSQCFPRYQHRHLYSNGPPPTAPPSVHLKGPWPWLRLTLCQLRSNDRRKCRRILDMLIVIPCTVRRTESVGQCIHANSRRSTGNAFSGSVRPFIRTNRFNSELIDYRPPSHHLSCFRGKGLVKRHRYTPCAFHLPRHASTIDSNYWPS